MAAPNVLQAQTVDELRDWYERNYRSASEMWLVNPSKASGRPGVSYNDAVEVALCYGWIDSVRRRHDDDSTVQRYSPRRRGSGYSQPNIERLRRLRDDGLVVRAGDLVGTSRTFRRAQALLTL